MDERAEGVYCHWESYPPETPGIENNIFVAERVCGDATVARFECTRHETRALLKFLLPEIATL